VEEGEPTRTSTARYMSRATYPIRYSAIRELRHTRNKIHAARGLFEPPCGTKLTAVRESLQVGGGRIDFALHMGVVGFGIVIAQHAPLVLLLLACAACLAWTFVDRVRAATTSWLRMVYAASLWAQRAADDSLEEDSRARTVYRGYRQHIGAPRDGAPLFGTIVVREEGNVVSKLLPRRANKFDWGNLTDEGADLAWTLLGEGVAPEVYEGFQRSVVARLPDTWRLTAEDIEGFARCWPVAAIAEIGSTDAARAESVIPSSQSDRLASTSA